MAKITLTKMASRGLDDMGRPYWRIRAPSPTSPSKRETVAAGRWTDIEARDELARVEARATLGLGLSPVSARTWSVSDVVEAYLQDLGTRMGEAQHVRQEARRLTHVLLHLGAFRADTITRARLEAYAATRRRDPNRSGRATAKKSITEEIHALLRAYRSCKEMGRTSFDPPPYPSLKSIPDDRRPARRLTEEEVARLVEAAEKDDPKERPLPDPGTWTRAVLDLVAQHPGITAAELVEPVGKAGPNVHAYLTWLMKTGLVVADRSGPRARYHARDSVPHPAHQGLADLLTVLAWTGRRPVAVFDARRQDCERLLDEDLPRRERLMYWRTDKGGVGRGWGPVGEPALEALARRARAVDDPEGFLWRTATGEPFTTISINRVWHRIARKAGVEGAQPYDLRRFGVTRLLREARGQVGLVQQFTGHRSVRALLTYVFAEQGAAEELAEFVGWSAGAGLRVVES